MTKLGQGVRSWVTLPYMFWFQGEPPAGGGPEHLPRLRHAHRPRLLLRGIRGEGVGSAPGGEIIVVVVVVAVNKHRENIYSRST